MAQQVYTIRMWAASSAVGGPVFSGPTVPAGFVWVVRDVRMLNTAPSGFSLAQPMQISSGGPLPIAESPVFSSLAGELYEWHGRAVVGTGETLVARTSSSNWTWVVDGYQLALP